jgi:hypothetical protein
LFVWFENLLLKTNWKREEDFKTVKVFKFGGLLNSDAVVPPPATAPENSSWPEKMNKGGAVLVSFRKRSEQFF